MRRISTMARGGATIRPTPTAAAAAAAASSLCSQKRTQRSRSSCAMSLACARQHSILLFSRSSILHAMIVAQLLLLLQQQSTASELLEHLLCLWILSDLTSQGKTLSHSGKGAMSGLPPSSSWPAGRQQSQFKAAPGLMGDLGSMADDQSALEDHSSITPKPSSWFFFFFCLLGWGSFQVLCVLLTSR